MPLFIDGGNSISHPSKLNRAIERLLEEQYGASQVEGYLQLPKAQRAVVVDDYHMINMNEQGKAELLRHLEEHFNVVVLLAGDEARFEEVKDNARHCFK